MLLWNHVRLLLWGNHVRLLLCSKHSSLLLSLHPCNIGIVMFSHHAVMLVNSRHGCMGQACQYGSMLEFLKTIIVVLAVKSCQKQVRVRWWNAFVQGNEIWCCILCFVWNDLPAYCAKFSPWPSIPTISLQSWFMIICVPYCSREMRWWNSSFSVVWFSKSPWTKAWQTFCEEADFWGEKPDDACSCYSTFWQAFFWDGQDKVCEPQNWEGNCQPLHELDAMHVCDWRVNPLMLPMPDWSLLLAHRCLPALNVVLACLPAWCPS